GELAIDLAEQLESWAKVIEHVDEFVAAHPTLDKNPIIKSQKADALAKLGKVDDAKAVYNELTKDAKPDGNTINLMAKFARMLAEADDVAGARETWTKLKDLVPQVGNQVDDVLKDLEPIGS